MKFSVLMSLYFKEQPAYLAQCLQSLLKQTKPADEIVLVLDGAIGDELQQVIEQFKPQLPLIIVPLEKNMGLGKALNQGLLHCHHDWVFRMDTDDICFEDRFAKQCAFIEQHPDVVIVGGQIAEFNQDITQITGFRAVPTEHQQLVEFAKKRCPFNHMTVAYRKSAVLNCGGYEDLQEDYYLWLKLVATGQQLANLADTLVYARVGNGMVGRRRGMAQAQAEWRLFQLKRRLKIQNTLSGLLTFALRAGSRLLPLPILQKIYQILLRK